MAEFSNYYVKHRFQAVEITKVPMDLEEPAEWSWGPMGQTYYEQDYQIGNFLVREYIIGKDELEYKVVRRENFLTYYIKEEENAKHQQEAGAHDGSSSAQSQVCQESGYSASSSEGIQSGGHGEAQAPGAKGQVAVAYAVTVDGFIQVKHKVIRNPQSPFIVWMSEAQWTKLANCASEQGLFYIPRTDTIDSPAVLRALVANT